LPVSQRKLNRVALQTLAGNRLADAQALLNAGRLDAAYYLAGYAIECAIKAYIAKATVEHEFPDKGFVEKSWKHGLIHLMNHAGLQGPLNTAQQADPDLAENWATVAQWNEHFRYYEGITQQEAIDIVQAVGDPQHGVLQWLRQHW
jgi:HEPN domain-containing protein